MIKYNNKANSSYTSAEIMGQPFLWQRTYEDVVSSKEELSVFMNKVLVYDNLRVILTGAGTSAFIGDVLHKEFQKKFGRSTEVIASTDFISHPAEYIMDSEQPVLMVSFARSGDSPESVATVDLANEYCTTIFHLIITCNPSGKLANLDNLENSFVLLMPTGANDKGLAMTASFTTMLLAGILVSDIKGLERNKKHVEHLVGYGNTILNKYAKKIKAVATLEFDRVVFLGSGALKGIARESHLKVQELSDGQVICKYDSFLGLRHGPQAVINGSTLVVYLFSNNDFVNKYEYDLVRSINRQKEKLYEIGIGELIKNKESISLDLSIEVAESNNIPEEFFAVCAVLPSQLLGLFKSLDLGLSPDSPSVNNSINRVVQGVRIYKKK
tara:strand:- start:29121 stop:30272 length:1152 start_codon:yes stop_codon:yes gene_type:complete